MELAIAEKRLSSVAAERINALAVDALVGELVCYPKPGLVSLIDNGSHADMDASTFRASIAALDGYFCEMAEAGAQGADFGALNAIGRRAEARMFEATNGVNTHRGAVFSLGLLSAAAGFASLTRRQDPETVTRLVEELWGEDIAASGAACAERSHGAAVRARYSAPGAREEAAAGFPTVLEHSLPAFQTARQNGASVNDAMVQAVFAVISVLDDNNLLYRGGVEALERAQALALEFLGHGGITAEGGRDRAIEVHRVFVENRWSPGGAADLLSATLFLAHLETPERGKCR